jgi:hypothetical protein
MSDRITPGGVGRAAMNCSYLLRVHVRHDGTRYLVQDLKTGERHEFDSEAQLRRFIAERGSAGLR